MESIIGRTGWVPNVALLPRARAFWGLLAGTLACVVCPTAVRGTTIMLNTLVGPGGTPANTSHTTAQPVGTLSWDVLGSGDVKVTLLQYVNDNTYGTNASAGWPRPHGHSFNDLVGSDEAEFKFTDGKGNVVLDFKADYISKVTSLTLGGQTVNYGSGYGTAGLGGDGKLVSGSASNILSIDTTLTDDLNQSPAFYGFTTNSPTPGTSAYAHWNVVNGYTVLVSHSAFGANGFGAVTVPEVHDSPAMNYSPSAVPVPSAVWGGLTILGSLAVVRFSRRSARRPVG